MNLFGAQAFYSHETTKVVMIREDENLMIATF